MNPATRQEIPVVRDAGETSCACLNHVPRTNTTTTQITLVLTITHDVLVSPAQLVGGALAEIRDAVDATASDRGVAAHVVDAEVGTAVYGVPVPRRGGAL